MSNFHKSPRAYNTKSLLNENVSEYSSAMLVAPLFDAEKVSRMSTKLSVASVIEFKCSVPLEELLSVTLVQASLAFSGATS